MKVNSAFFGGRIEAIAEPSRGETKLRLMPDPGLGFRQWFYFAVEGSGPAVPHPISIDVSGSLVPAGWNDYQAFRSVDNVNWERVATTYRSERLVIEHVPADVTTYYAYFPPYRPSDHEKLLKQCAIDGRFSVDTLCTDGPEDRYDLIGVGSAEAAALKIWVIGRQHPGEVQASWWMEGFIRRLLDRNDVEAKALLGRVRLFIVPNMNPDGSRLGLHRTNRHGRNLNASWDAPSADETPAVFAALTRMEHAGVDFCLDVHGDEELPYAFVANVDRVAPVPDEIAEICDAFQQALASKDPGFLSRAGRTRPHTLRNPLSFCSPQVMHRFRKPAATLELPYKKFQAGQDQEREYGPAGCIATGRASVSALAAMLDALISLRRRAG
ncbi:MAG: hypothetical protein GC202_03015 [Alphaproteobacteria bacterium]|nr:hypothetical protein [Alphaproteobacteria bacterium]